MDVRTLRELAALVGSEAAYTCIKEVWFELLADGDAADLAAGPGGNRGGAPPLLGLLTGVLLSDGALGTYTPSHLQEPSHLEMLHPGLCGPHEHRYFCSGGLAAADAAGGGDRAAARLCRREWDHMMQACLEAWGPNLFLRKAVTAVGPHGASLVGRLVLLGGRSGWIAAATGTDGLLGATAGRDTSVIAAALMMLRATGRMAKGLEEIRSFVRHALPDGDVLAASSHLEDLVALHQTLVHRALIRGASVANPPLRRMYAPKPVAPPTDSIAIEDAASASTSIAVKEDNWNSIKDEQVSSREALPSVADKANDTLNSADTNSGGLLPSADSSTGFAATVSSSSPSPLFVDAHVCIGSDLAEGQLHVCSESPDMDGMNQCCICFERMPRENLRHCGRSDCGKKAYCLDCLRQHAETVVRDGLYAVPSVRCPSCNKRLATEAWTSIVNEEILFKYKENSRALLTYRCAACDETGSYLSTASVVHRDPFAASELDVRERLANAWRNFFLADISGEEFLQAILGEYGCAHREGGAPPTKLSKIFGASGGAPWITDLERRLTVQVAWMHRFPRQRTPCCGERFCFRCKISSWHRGLSCRERLQAEKARQAQICPGCGVPTQRSEGCRKITCVCGRVWEWEGDESSEEGGFSDDGSEEDESTQAQTAANLISMNTWAKCDNVKDAIHALIEARADVNDSVAGSSLDSSAPLMLAVQYHNSAAASILCEHGAKVTREILEEVKLISHEVHRQSIELTFKPHVQGDPNMKLPLWVWVQSACVPAVEALLRNSAHEEEVNTDVMTALHRCVDEQEKRSQITALLRERVGEDGFKKLEASAATRRMLLELRQAYDEERNLNSSIICDALALGADANAREDGDDDEVEGESSKGLAALGLISMNCHANADSIERAIEALLEAKADVNLESDDADAPLQLALQHRNLPAIKKICQGPVRFTTEILDEMKTISDSSRRQQVFTFMGPVLHSQSNRRLPLWVWVQEGNISAVNAFIQAKDPGEQLDADVFVALQRCPGSEAVRQEIAQCLHQVLDQSEVERLQIAAATRRLLQELREAYDDQRTVCIETIRETLALEADANAQEEDREIDDANGAYNLSALQVLVTNTHIGSETMQIAVKAMVDARANVNLEVNETPLLSALQHRCIAGVEALSRNGARVNADVLEELKSVSGTKSRLQIEDMLQPLIDADKSLRIPLWVWVLAGNITAVEALLRNAAHDEDIDADVIMALQRCRREETKDQLSSILCERVGDHEFSRLVVTAATRRLLLEVREAHTEQRDIDLDLLRSVLMLGANPNAREEALDDADDEDLEAGEEEDEEEEDGEDNNDDNEDSSDSNENGGERGAGEELECTDADVE